MNIEAKTVFEKVDVEVKVKKKKSAIQKRESLTGILFVSPMLIGVSVLTLLPILATFLLSFADWNFIVGFNSIKFVGLDNFKALFENEVFLKSVLNNLLFLLTVPLSMLFSLIIAIVIDKHVYAKSYFKVAFFMPYISSIVAIAVVWQVLFNPTEGPINQLLFSLGIDNPPTWIADPDFALISVMVIQIWASIGFSMIIYLAGLQSIPKELYEAADMDGARAWDKFKHIMLPVLSPTTFFLLITGIIGTFKVFDLIAVLTKGGPINSTTMLVWHLYESAFVNLKIGYASAIAVVLFFFVLIITLVQWVGQKKWVNY
ncbi:sugar ABC transporter permease [Neobacillus sp. MM2021_6]|uniref:carbohydrate ABC transporter permease n=1 Tax=Bacillaceae TaxID=186817 RepID=UPI001A9430D6|nr:MULTISPECIES: sugar ABC transporter permease [Bacillaceae]MBO0961608.1 sugar ABC transporter permease [Neobacillus sp. MM2021_6]WML38565.1 sugar ABC transporter permease [Neobacillus sp. OS1-2]